MQKLDYTENLQILVDELKSYDIKTFIDNLPVNQPVNANPLTAIIVESKSNFDKINSEDKRYEILASISALDLYNQNNISLLLNALSASTVKNEQKVNLFLKSNVLSFYSFHTSLINANLLAKNVLFTGHKSEETEEIDVVIFRILTNEKLEVAVYAKILNLIRDLIEIIQKANNIDVIEPTVTLLDSGSDTNLGIKTTVETAKSLFQIFKEVWDWVLNRKFYNNKLRNSALLDNLNVMMTIKSAEESGAIDQNTAKIYRETLIRRTEDLLDLNVIPKMLIETNTREDSRKLLKEYSDIKLLETGN